MVSVLTVAGAVFVVLVPSARPADGVESGSHPVMLVVDISGSMADDDGSGRIKIEGAKLALLNFLRNVDADTPVGLRIYPDQTTSGCNSGRLAFQIRRRDPAEMGAAVRRLKADGDTPTAEAMLAAVDDLEAQGYSSGSLVIVSDGESTCAPPCEAANAIVARGFDLQVVTVGFQISDQGRVELECIADAMGGTYVDVSDGAGLVDAVDQVTRPTLSVALAYPKATIAEVGEDESAGVPIEATITNTSQAVARNATARLRFDSEGPGVLRPVRALGNLAPGASMKMTWSFRPSLLTVTRDVRFTVVARAANTASDAEASGSVTVADATTADRAGPILRGSGSLVILGDSYSAGEGADEYLLGTDAERNRCHRSLKTYLAETFSIPAANVLACSGAVSADISAPNGGNHVEAQAKQLADVLSRVPGSVSGVAMTLGGNDAGFPDVARSCLLAARTCARFIYTPWFNPRGTKTGDFVEARIEDRLVGDLIVAYSDINKVLNTREQIAARGYMAPIIVLSYPRPVPLTDRRCASLDLIEPAELDFLSTFLSKLNGTVEAAAIGARRSNIPVFYVPNVEEAFLPDHTVCDGKQAYARGVTSANGATIDWHKFASGGVATLGAEKDFFERSVQELFHPNQAGYQAMTRAVLRWSLSKDAADGRQFMLDRTPARSDAVATWPVGSVDLGQLGSGATPLVQGGTAYPLTTGGFAPNDTVTITLHSAPRPLGSARTDDTGQISTLVPIPPDTPGGRHQLVLQGSAPHAGVKQVTIAIAVADADRYRTPRRLAMSGATAGLGAIALLALTRRKRPARPDSSGG